jgi:A/G-specific adenine glycosylase
MNKRTLETIREQLRRWYAASKRRLPWRETDDPYQIWVSEVMLQQTQVKTVIPFFTSFLDRFPRVESLANADLEQVLKAWEGLGYYGRARNLHRAARLVLESHNGSVPRDPAEFRNLPGVGDYICAAVQSVAFGNPMAVVDGNVNRVLSRLFDIEAPVNKSSEFAKFQKFADRLLDHDDPGEFNQAVMELGALICRPATPRCSECPVKKQCRARRSSRQNELPVRLSRKPIPTHRVAVGVIEKDDRVLITRRRPEGLLGGLWEFPGGKIEGDEPAEAACSREIREETGLSVDVEKQIASVKHAYTHFKVIIDVFQCRYRGGDVVLDGPIDYRWSRVADIHDYPIPTASHKILRLLEKKSRKV